MNSQLLFDIGNSILKINNLPYVKKNGVYCSFILITIPLSKLTKEGWIDLARIKYNDSFIHLLLYQDKDDINNFEALFCFD